MSRRDMTWIEVRCLCSGYLEIELVDGQYGTVVFRGACDCCGRGIELSIRARRGERLKAVPVSKAAGAKP